ncbi:sensor histidine kinase [Nocardioides humi]|uniref:sensor histidine kinase n=2 Tax=Nocardioides humi TaxID=449461 RepID=UPI0031D3AF6A
MDTSARSRRPVTVAAAVISAVAVVAVASLWVRGRSLDVQYGLFVFHNAPPALLLSWLGRLVVVRRPGNRIGPILLVIAGLGAAHCAVAALADVAIVRWGYVAAITGDHPLIPAEMPLSASVPFWIMNWLWLPQVVLLLTVLPAIFPDGSLPGPRWRVVPWLAGAGGLVFGLGLVLDAWPTGAWGTGETPEAVGTLLGLGLLVTGAATFLAVAALVVRWRHAAPAQRAPYHVVGSVFGVVAVLWVAAYPWPRLWTPAVLVGIQVLLLAYALAAARFRVHDLEPVLARSAVATGLSLAVTAAFVAVVLAVGVVAARLSDAPVLPWIAVGIVAVAADPVRRWARRRIDRLVFRLADDRTVVVSEIAAHAGEDAAEQLLRRVVDALHRSTGAARVEARLSAEGLQGAPEAAAGPVAAYRTCLAEPILSNGEQLGELRLLTDLPGDLAPGAAEVLADVARVAGTALHNSRLSSALAAQLDDLQASRRRLVEAHDTARRSVERDLHDGAQAQLVALRLRLAVLQTQADAGLDPLALRDGLAGVADEIDATVETLRTLARGLQPPILAQDGVAAALRSSARGLPLPVTVAVDGFGRYDAAVETALYFVCLEALQNAVRHGDAATAAVMLRDEGDVVSFTVSDDGRGFDPVVPRAGGSGLTNVADRLGALGGTLELDSSPGSGCRVHGRVPIG